MAKIETNIPALTEAINKIDSNYQDLLSKVNNLQNVIIEIEKRGGLRSDSAQASAKVFQETCAKMITDMNASRERYNQILNEKLDFWKVRTISGDESVAADIKSRIQ